ncbi:hypothetical protein [Crocosphaera sp.]|uniref:VMAP-C domain-containing protein n=1 Tax=Crocosphaera sp. TaxID=2729996 RepID=UPI00262F148B|nr:hypothetical protein [Crocosphaera sp.]MDJ0583162.1 hypothetical protein [Crocosphaera sp.]
MINTKLVNKPIISDSLNNNRLNFDESFVYLLIDLKLETSKVNLHDPDKFQIKTWLAFPESNKNFKHEELLETFKIDRNYTQVEIEEKLYSLIEECNQKLEEIKPEQDFEIAIEWIIFDDWSSSSFDCWEYRHNKTIGCGPFFSVHIRSSQRLHPMYKHCRKLWKNKWDELYCNSQSINSTQYILACECNDKNEQDLQIIDNEENPILGINLPVKLESLENLSYESFIEMGIPLILWSRCEDSTINHSTELDNLINTDENNPLNFKTLPQSIKEMRSEARKLNQENSNHLGYHLCFLWENPYNYPEKELLNLE